MAESLSINKSNLKGCIMKTKYVFLTTVLTVLLTMPMIGQYGNTDDTLQKGSKNSGMSMAKPVYESTIQGTHLKVWVMTQAEHMKMMGSKTMKDSSGMDRLGTDMDSKSGSMGMNQNNSGGVTGTATHHIRIEATDETSGQMQNNITGTIQVTSPSMKTASVDIQSEPNHYAADVNLSEKGQYQFTLNLTVDGTSKTAQFQYTPNSSNSSENLMH
jgi:hypothetical protein